MSQSNSGSALSQPTASNRAPVPPDLLALLIKFNENFQLLQKFHRDFLGEMQNFAQTLANLPPKYQLDVKIRGFNGQNWPRFKKDVERYLFAIGKKRFLDEDILARPEPASEAELQEDMLVRCFIGSKCSDSIKRDAERHSKSAFQMWNHLNCEYFDREVNEAVDQICDIQLNCVKDLDKHLKRLNEAFNVLETNQMPINDHLRSQILFRSLGEVGQRIACKTANYIQTLVHVRGYLATKPCPLQENSVNASDHNCVNPKRLADSRSSNSTRQRPIHIRGGHPYLTAGNRLQQSNKP